MCCSGVEGGGLGVAGDDRLVDHSVLGDVDAGAARLGDRVVAQPLPQRLVHQRRRRGRRRRAAPGCRSSPRAGGERGGRRSFQTAMSHRLGLHRGEQVLGRGVALRAARRRAGRRRAPAARAPRARPTGDASCGAPRRAGGRRPRTSPRPGASRRRPAAAARRSPRAPTRGDLQRPASSRSDGSRSPGASAPERMSAASRSATCS